MMHAGQFLDRAQLLTSVVNRNEFHALLLLHWNLLPELVETKVKTQHQHVVRSTRLFLE